MRNATTQAKFRREVFAANKQHDETGRIFLVCYLCNHRIDPATTAWDADHVTPDYFGGQKGMPICKPCHKEKTAKEDVPAIAKSKRTYDKHYGIKRRGSTWPQRKFSRRVED